MSPSRSTASSTTRLWTKVASWAFPVGVSSSIGASHSSAARSRPAAADASATTSHEGWSVHACPIPERWDPCPGKVNTNTLICLRTRWGTGAGRRTPSRGGGRRGVDQVWHGPMGASHYRGVIAPRPAPGRRRDPSACQGGRGYAGRMRAAVVQLASGPDRAATRERSVAAARRAASEGADLVVLPEAAMADFGRPGRDLTSSAEPLDGPFVGALHELARHTGITTVAGMFEPSPEPGRVYNTLVVVGPAGLRGAYRKCHLFDALGWRESAQVTAGDPGALVCVEVGGMVCGVMTCYDLRFPEMARALVDRGAEVLVEAAHFVAGPGKTDVWRTLVAARAIESTAYVVAAAKPAPECVGHSMVVDPAGLVLTELAGAGEGVAVADLVPGRLAEVRRALPVLSHRRFSVRAGAPMPVASY